MVAQSSQSTTSAQERRSAHVIHYNISYVVQGAGYGTGGAIVLLHDILGGAFTWDGVLAGLAVPGRAVYAIDMLGYGQSDRPWPADTSIWGHADCLAILFQQLNLTNIVLVGHGIGGGVAQVLATRLCPERVAALVLLDTVCYEYTFASNWPLSDMKKYQVSELGGKKLELKDLIADLEATAPNGSYNSDGFKQHLDSYVQPWNDEIGKEVLLQQVRLLIPAYSNSVSTDLKSMGKPALIIWGEKDAQIPLKFAQRLHREIPESRLVIIPGAGHTILFDAPEQVAGALADFVGRL
jgi:pimeloyl-ACP methyl ester carboxylesterase